MNIRLAGLDLETTGLLDPQHRIIECCVEEYLWDGVKLHELGGETWRIDPQRPIDAKAYEVHKISSADLIGCPTFDQVADFISARLDGCDIVVGHNLIDFDGPFIIQELDRVKSPIFNAEPFDTMLKGRWATAMGAVPSLGALCFACGVEYDDGEAHAAKYDVQKMMECLEYGLKRGLYVLPSIQ